MHPEPFAIFYKIEGSPFSGIRHEAADSVILKTGVAFCTMLSDCVSAALAGNLPDTHCGVAVTAAVASGYFGCVYVTDLGDSLSKLEALMRHLELSSICEISWRGFGSAIVHHSGPKLGNGEDHIKEAIAMEDMLTRTVKRP